MLKWNGRTEKFTIISKWGYVMNKRPTITTLAVYGLITAVNSSTNNHTLQLKRLL